MKVSNHVFGRWSLCLAVLFVSPTGHAEIYKWVDANGQTHFSERKDNAGKAKALELKPLPQTNSTQATSSSPEYWQDQEIQFRRRQIEAKAEKPHGPSLITKPKPLSDGTSDGSDASRCNLARDVLSGAVRHSNGAPTDAYDREVAENDVRSYCH